MLLPYIQNLYLAYKSTRFGDIFKLKKSTFMPQYTVVWSLDKFLDVLQVRRFCINPLENSLLKTLFMLGLVTADRISELNSLMRGGTYLVYGRNSHLLSFMPIHLFWLRMKLLYLGERLSKCMLGSFLQGDIVCFVQFCSMEVFEIYC